MIDLPQSYLDQPRWWHDGQEWLARLPGTVEEQCRRWGLQRDGALMHGANALVVPVLRGTEPLALRLTPPEDDVAAEVAALTFWAGRGTVKLVDADPARGAMLLERLDGSRSLQQLPLVEAAPIIGRMMRRLAVPAPPDILSTAVIAATRLGNFAEHWQRAGRPFAEQTLQLALRCATDLSSTESAVAVNGDLHYEQVLAGTREEWLCVDPVLLRGDIEYDLARILWSRLDEMSDGTVVLQCFDAVIHAARLNRERARTWVIFRSVDYWLWGLDRGLTEDPVRCARLVKVFG